MPITNIFTPEDLIIARLKEIIDKDMIFVEANSSDLNNDFFNDFDTDDEKIGALVLNSGYRADPIVGAARQQRLKMLWQVVVVCPKKLYNSHGGVKMIEVMNLFKGYRLAPEFDYMQLIDDERGFNRPEYANDLTYLPMMFTVGTVI